MSKQRFTYEDLYGHVRAAFKKMGCTEDDASTCTNVLMAAELRGIPSHGIMRLKDYMLMWQKGKIKARPNVTIVHETATTAVIDADQAFGAVAGSKAMRVAIRKAEKYGSAWISVRNSSHYGIAGYYAMMALKKDMIGMAMTNANPLVAPTFSVDRFLGTNPIAVAVPAGKEPPFVADFATAPIARGKLAIKEREGQSVPTGYVQNPEGEPSTDPGIITRGGAIVPLGGDYEHGSHKGYSMSAIVDIFSAVLSRANFGPFVPPQVPYLEQKEGAPGSGLGHFFGVMSIDGFQAADEFKAYMDEWIKTFKNAKPASGQKEVLVPGEPERRNEISFREEGIPVSEKVIADIREVYEILGLKFSL
jgi:LDH2 family malate/lactate/ureidoglycolate dehydrogenase